MAALATQAASPDLDHKKKLEIVDRLLKWEAMKQKSKSGRMGAAFNGEEE